MASTQIQRYRNILSAGLVTLLLTTLSAASATALHIFQTKPGSQIYTPLYWSKGVKVRGDKLYYRQNTNANGSVIFDADQYGKDSVLLSAALGRQGEVYVLANLQKGDQSESTVLKIRASDKAVLAKVSLKALGLENISPANFSYDPQTNAVKVSASRGYTTQQGTPSAQWGKFWVSLSGTPRIISTQMQ